MVKNNKCMINENIIDKILPGLYLGGINSCKSDILSKYKIKVVLKVMPEFDIPLDQKLKDIQYFHIPIKDNDTCGIDINNLFDKCADTIYHKLMIEKKGNILVHCKQGHHRSACIIGAFLIKYLNIDYITAVQYIKSIRPCALRRNVCVSECLINYYLYIKKINQ